MKRSEVNAILRKTDDFIRSYKFALPPFAYWSPDDWRSKGEEVREIVDNHLGWDITDYGLGQFDTLGLTLFTIRNGTLSNLKSATGKVYAEKLLICEPNQISPFHYHWTKVEDIINRGGGPLRITLHNSTPEGGLADTEITVSMDGVVYQFEAGHTVSLHEGESITLPTGLYHKFWTQDEKCLVGEVSTVNDDYTDNKFLDPIGRFPEIEEDEPPLYLLVNDVAQYYNPTRS
jgi:D-lyxose ketol-isomerase